MPDQTVAEVVREPEIVAEPEVVQEAKPLIPNWTYEDFLTEEPYRYIYEVPKNKFIQQTMLNRATALSKQLHFPTFIKTWQSYQASRSSNVAVLGSNQTMFEKQPLQLACGQYDCTDEYGIVYYGNNGEKITVCSHPIMPVLRVVNMDTNEEKLKISYRRGTKRGWQEQIVSKDVLASAQKIIGLAKLGISVNSENAKEMVKFLGVLEDMNYDGLDVQKSTSHLGWLPDGQFAPYCEDIQYDGESAEFKRMFSGFTETGDRETWMKIAKDTRSGRSVPARIALAASFAAPLIKPLGGLPYFVHLWGTQGCGKTVGLMLAASVWANPDVGQYIKTFGGTKVSQEIYASFCGNVPILLDELQVISDRRMFDDIIYMLCEGTSKGRGAKEGGLQLQRHWSSTIITTGEMPIVQSNSGGGAAVRTIEVNYGGEPLFEDARTVANTLKQNYGFAGKEFVEALKDKETMDALRDIQKRFYSQLSGDIQDKQVLAASILLAADRLADTVIFHDGKALTVDEIKPYLITKEQADVNGRCYDWLCGYIASNPVRFEENENSGELWGKIEKDGDREIVYFIKSAFDKALTNGGFSTGSFLTWAKRKGLLKLSKTRGDRTTVQRRFAGHLTGCVPLYLPAEDQTSDITPDDLIQVEDDDMPF